MMWWCVRAFLAGMLVFSGSSGLAAQALGVGQKLQTGSVAPLQAPTPRVALPPPEHMLGLIRTTIIALNQANQTGNYTVLRDLSAPDFRDANDASRLAAIFQVLRDQAIDLTPLLQIAPEVSDAPAITAEGLLRLTGFFPTEPLRVNFDLSFQALRGQWRPYTISVYMARIEAQIEAPQLRPQAPVANHSPVQNPKPAAGGGSSSDKK